MVANVFNYVLIHAFLASVNCFWNCIWLYLFITISHIKNVFLQEDDDGHVIALQTIYDLLTKCQDIFLDHFARLGVFCKVQQFIGPENVNAQQINSRQVWFLV